MVTQWRVQLSECFALHPVTGHVTARELSIIAAIVHSHHSLHARAHSSGALCFKAGQTTLLPTLKTMPPSLLQSTVQHGDN